MVKSSKSSKDDAKPAIVDVLDDPAIDNIVGATDIDAYDEDDDQRVIPDWETDSESIYHLPIEYENESIKESNLEFDILRFIRKCSKVAKRPDLPLTPSSLSIMSPTLMKLNLWNRSIKIIPDCIDQLSSLKRLYLGKNSNLGYGGNISNNLWNKCTTLIDLGKL